MNPRAWKALRPHRVRTGIRASTDADENNGYFVFKHPADKRLKFQIGIADGGGWDHVSVTVVSKVLQLSNHPQYPNSRIPLWHEMCFIKDLFWLPEESAFQLHPPQSMYVNDHPHVLHQWWSQTESFPMPPMEYV